MTWHVERYHGFLIMDDLEIVAKVPIKGKDDFAWKRAKLLAAAPEMAEALREIIKLAVTPADKWAANIALAALSRAEGK